MALVPLYDEFPSDGSSHNVCAPGGYENWRLCAYDPRADLMLLIALWNGYPHDLEYHKAYRQYRKRPTQFPPPLPRDYASEEMAWYGGGISVGGSRRTAPIDSFPVSGVGGLEISQAKGQIMLEPVGAPPLSLTTLNGSHHWQLSNPLVQVSAKNFGLSFNAMGFCDNRYGDSPVNFQRFLDGCAFFPSGIFIFQATSTTSWIVHLTTSATQVIDQPLNCQPKMGFGDAAPAMIRLGEQVTLSNPRRIEQQRSRLRVMYEAKFANETGRGFCEVYFPISWSMIYSSRGHRTAAGEADLTWSPLPPADKSSPSAPECVPGPSSSP